MYHRLLLTIVMTCIVVAGCDPKEDKSSPGAAAAQPSAQDRNAAYLKKLEPLSDALLRIEVLLRRPNDLQYPTFRDEMKQVDFGMLKAESALDEQERSRSSFLQAREVLKSLRAIELYLATLHRLSQPGAAQGMGPHELIQGMENIALIEGSYVPKEVEKARAGLAALRTELQRGN